jgi:hypothetical protein
MKYTIFWVPNEGVHPHATQETYDRIWPIMHRSVRKLGHKLIHITDEKTPSLGDEVYRVPGLNPKHTMKARDEAWLNFLLSLDADEQACMIEPDTLMLRDVPPISDGYDMVLLRRFESCVPGWFKLAKRSAAPFYQQVVDNYANVPQDLWGFHGDIHALHMACGIGAKETAHAIPSEACGVTIEVRNWPCYGFRKAHSNMRNQVFFQFKGTSKKDMQ